MNKLDQFAIRNELDVIHAEFMAVMTLALNDARRRLADVKEEVSSLEKVLSVTLNEE